MRTRLSDADYEKIIHAFVVELVPMIELAERFNVSRMGIWKVLQRAGIDTTKQAAHISTTCENCNQPITKIRCTFRKNLHSFCNRSCYFKWLNRHQPTNPLISSRQGMRIARKIISSVFDLQPEHIVHHEDRDNTNNNPTNLRVFASNGDHVKYHRGLPITPIFNGANLEEYNNLGNG